MTSLIRAAGAGTLSTHEEGAQSSLPRKTELDDFVAPQLRELAQDAGCGAAWQLHLEVLRGCASSCSAAALPSVRAGNLKVQLQQRDLMGLTPVHRAWQCCQLAPSGSIASRHYMCSLRQLLTAQLLLLPDLALEEQMHTELARLAALVGIPAPKASADYRQVSTTAGARPQGTLAEPFKWAAVAVLGLLASVLRRSGGLEECRASTNAFVARLVRPLIKGGKQKKGAKDSEPGRLRAALLMTAAVDGTLMLHAAARAGNLDLLEALLDELTNLQRRDTKLRDELQLAAGPHDDCLLRLREKVPQWKPPVVDPTIRLRVQRATVRIGLYDKRASTVGHALGFTHLERAGAACRLHARLRSPPRSVLFTTTLRVFAVLRLCVGCARDE